MKILVVGDFMSYPSTEGYKWCELLQSDKVSVTNLSAKGGSSNEQIFQKTIEACLNTTYNLVIVQWSYLCKLSLCKSTSLDIVTFTSAGINQSYPEFDYIWREHFFNKKYELSFWLTKLTFLASYFKSIHQPFIFVKGFENCLIDLSVSDWRECNLEYKQFILNYHNLPDDQIDLEHNKLTQKFKMLVDYSADNWVNLTSDSWFASSIDINDTGLYPGVNSHKIFYNMVKLHCEKLGFF